MGLSQSTTRNSNHSTISSHGSSQSKSSDGEQNNGDGSLVDHRLVKTVEAVVKGESKCIKVLGSKINIPNMEFLISSLSNATCTTTTTTTMAVVEQVWLTCSDLVQEEEKGQEEDEEEKQCTSVSALDLLCLFFGQHDASIHTILFSRNEFGNDNISRILPVFYRNQILLELNLSTNKIQGAAGGAAIRALVEENEHLKKLVLWNNPLGDDGARELAAGLVVNKTLEYLDLGLCSLGNDGLDFIVNALTAKVCVQVQGQKDDSRSSRTRIKFLDLHANNLTSQALSSFTDLLSSPSSPRIETLDVWHTPDLLKDANLVCPFACALARNKFVRRLNLRECGMNDMAALWLFPALEVNTTLDFVNVYCEHEQLGPIGCQQLLKSLPQLNPRHVMCNATFWPGSHADAFLAGIEKNMRLHVVNGNHVMGTCNHEKLKFILERNKLYAHAIGLVNNQDEAVPLGIWPLALGKMTKANKTTDGVALSAIFEVLQNGTVAQWI